MTNIQARAIEKARREFNRAQNELKVHRLSETRYRGIPTIQVDGPGEEVQAPLSIVELAILNEFVSPWLTPGLFCLFFVYTDECDKYISLYILVLFNHD